ncbi:MAG: UTP--glucose-1-phosphate uridylyltransferase [Bryobacterales bacterium]|nr:UTP--glucose-1-phosphate uridylyltransferase [Bryobacterales bacterium]
MTRIITEQDPRVRNLPLDHFCQRAAVHLLLEECSYLEDFRRQSRNLYERVRALFFLSAIHRFHLPFRPGVRLEGRVPYEGYKHLLERRYEEAIRSFLAAQSEQGVCAALSSALAAAYRGLAFQTLADQVRRSVRSVRGNQWMFRTGHPADHPIRIRPELASPDAATGLYPVLREATPVRMDFSHSGWSDIFFLGMDYPEGARVINASINLAVRQGDAPGEPRPPVEAYFRLIDEPVLRLASVDLGCVAEVTSLEGVFDYARDYLGLLKAAAIASGLVPPGMEGSGQALGGLLEQLTGRAGHGLEVVSRVNDIPKGSRLAVSTSLLACLIAVLMRATGQIANLTGHLEERERRLVAARAILGEWLAGSGGGWQDSGGVWPGIKLISGVAAAEDDVEFGVSRGCLLPGHHVFSEEEIPAGTREALQRSLVLVHGGMAQDVGPILEMVTERYLLRSSREWTARQEAIGTLDEIVSALRAGDIRTLGALTHRNFQRPIQTIIPWAENHFTELLIERVKAEFREGFWGFWMLGGMSGGGMGFLFDPAVKSRAQQRLGAIMSGLKRGLESGVPFAMEPVVYDFQINERGSWAELKTGADALLPSGYYTLTVPSLLKQESVRLARARRAELEQFGAACRGRPELAGQIQALFDNLLPQAAQSATDRRQELSRLLDEYGFDRVQHERIRAELRAGRIGLAQNRLPVASSIVDVLPEDVTDTRPELPEQLRQAGLDALAEGAAAVVTLAGGVGSRWTHGAGVVKALNPFARLGGRHRTFLEVHLAKSRRLGRRLGRGLPHVVTTSHLTHGPTERHLRAAGNYGYEGPLRLSPGRMVGLRLVPMVRDLRFAWEEMPQQILDEQKQKVRDSLRAALIHWAETAGEASDYTDNLPEQCLHPVGHWYEIPNLLRNGVLASLLDENPRLRCLMLHNVDTLGADVDPALLGLHLASNAGLTVEVIAREVEDRGGGLARVDGRPRLVEGLAFPYEALEFDLSYYNSNTFWLDIDRLLAVFGLSREDLADAARVTEAVRGMAARMPTYVTLKDVKRRWGRGQEDIFPVAQFEKLWGDMTTLPELECRYIVVSRRRGQQLKEVAQLDPWLRDGSAAYVESLCDWG